MDRWEELLKNVAGEVDEIKFTGTLEEFMIEMGLSFNKLCTKVLGVSRGAGQRILRGENSPSFISAFRDKFPNTTITDYKINPSVFIRDGEIIVKEINEVKLLDVLLSECDKMREQLNLLTAGIIQVKYSILTGNKLIQEFEEIPEEIEDVDGDLI